MELFNERVLHIYPKDMLTKEARQEVVNHITPQLKRIKLHDHLSHEYVKSFVELEEALERIKDKEIIIEVDLWNWKRP